MSTEALQYNVAALRKMAENFGSRLNVATVSELVERGAIFVEDGNHGENRPRQDEFAATGIAFLRPPDLKDGRVDFESCGRINEAGFRRVRKGIGKRGDIILTHRATVGRIAITDDDAPNVFVTNPGTTIWRSTDPSVLDQRYLYCFMRSSAFMDQLWSQVGNNSTFDYVSLTQQRGLSVAFPPLPEQQAIAAVLGALDDKIELNRRMSTTLEAMARALFQSWFVDFDPVRAKAEGRPPAGLDEPTAALFPAQFQDSELGEIPQGWETRSLGDIVELAYGKPLKAEHRNGGKIAVYGSNGVVGWHDQKLVSGPGIVVGRKGNPGFVRWSHGDFFPIDTTFYVVPNGACRSLYFLYYALSLHNLGSLSADSAVPGLNRNHVYMSKQLLPPPSLLAAFDQNISPIFAAINANEHQSRTLATLRDALLPRLLSGTSILKPNFR
ncbi:MAG TPA: restriction endonuclease subunit S [Chthoniobacterales bacterium]|jgi:type I restriction enzyme S subunit